ncbi:MAG: hypothetical protein K8T26_10665 [Lentisphaerae bacterium]|nr:hypothetical protein [Lentisphaerota bacterium]
MNATPAAAESKTPPPPPMDTSPPLTALLRAPASVGARIAAPRELLRHGRHFLLAAIAGHAAFGLAAGLFGGVSAGLMGAAKVPLIALGAFLLCLPSLYVFCNLAGAPLSGEQITVVGLACLALVGLLLAALAPVVWLFAVSTSSLPFVVVLDLLACGIGLVYAFRLPVHLRQAAGLHRMGGLRVWLLVLTVTSLQMLTFLRPVIAAPVDGWWTPKKQFFLKHFTTCFEESAHRH